LYKVEFKLIVYTTMTWQTSNTLFENQIRPEHPYFQEAFDFMKIWESGEQEFSLKTSGSSGTPKTITVLRKQLLSSARMTGDILELGSGTKALVCLNIRYIAGTMMLVRGMELGWEMTIEEPSLNPLLGLGQESVFDFVAMVPAQLMTCLQDKSTASRVNKLGKILIGGAPVDVSLLRKIEELSVPVYQSYGMTETVSHVALRRLNGDDAREDYQVLSDIHFGTDERSCLYVGGAVTNGELIQTNDIVEITSSKTFKWLGRADNIINSGGVKIILDKIDEVVAVVMYDLCISVSFFAWYQIDDKWGQKLILILEASEADLSAANLISEIRKRVSEYETPKHVYFVDRFEKTATDKIDKRRTAELLFNS